MRIKPPQFIPNAPRTIKSWKQWKANEYLTFIVYYLLPIFLNIMDADQFYHLSKLVIFLEVLLSKSIEFISLDYSQVIIQQFVRDLTLFYPQTILLSGMHELLHSNECTKRFGPLNCTNCFQFEELNRKLLGLMSGRKLIGEEIIKLFTSIQTIFKLARTITYSSVDIQQFIESELKCKTTNRKNLSKSQNNVKLSAPFSSQTENDFYTRIEEKEIDAHKEPLQFFKKTRVQGIVFTSFCLAEQTKRNDSCVVASDSAKIGIIQCFFRYENNAYVICKQVVKIRNPFFSIETPQLKSSLVICTITPSSFFVSKISSIKKLALINISQHECYICEFSSSHLFN